MDRFEKNVLETIRREKLIPEGAALTVGFSGGADSVCLLSVLAALKGLFHLSLNAVHVNHGIRGAEADRDEEFCRVFCREREIPFTAVRVDVPAYVKETGMSVEEAARTLRYRALFQEAETAGKTAADKAVRIAVAHHADDQAETVLLNLIRGTGLKGLSGMAYERDGIIRPLLDRDREEILSYLTDHGLSFVTDSTNLENDYARNRIRNVVLPELKKINERAAGHIVLAGSLCGEAEAHLAEEAKTLLSEALISEEKEKNLVLSRNLLKTIPQILRRYVIIEALRRLGVPLKDWGETHIRAAEEAVTAHTGCHTDLPGGVTTDNETHETIKIQRGMRHGKLHDQDTDTGRGTESGDQEGRRRDQ